MFLYTGSEDRYITIGRVGEIAYVIFVGYTERKDVIHLISARKATRLERRLWWIRHLTEKARENTFGICQTIAKNH